MWQICLPIHWLTQVEIIVLMTKFGKMEKAFYSLMFKIILKNILNILTKYEN